MIELLEMVSTVLSIIGIPFLLWNSVRAKFLKVKFEGKYIEVPTDAIKEEIRRSALAEISRLNGGRRVNLKYIWKGNTLLIEIDKGVVPYAN